MDTYPGAGGVVWMPSGSWLARKGASYGSGSLSAHRATKAGGQKIVQVQEREMDRLDLDWTSGFVCRDLPGLSSNQHRYSQFPKQRFHQVRWLQELRSEEHTSE